MRLQEIECSVPNAKAYRNNVGLQIIISIDDTPKWGKLKHVSISREDMYPAWDEILRVKEHFFGDIDCMMMLPKKEDYVNIHSYCFHIWQCPEGWGLQ